MVLDALLDIHYLTLFEKSDDATMGSGSTPLFDKPMNLSLGPLPLVSRIYHHILSLVLHWIV